MNVKRKKVRLGIKSSYADELSEDELKRLVDKPNHDNWKQALKLGAGLGAYGGIMYAPSEKEGDTLRNGLGWGQVGAGLGLGINALIRKKQKRQAKIAKEELEKRRKI